MKALSRLLATEDPEQRIMKAELARELGLFDETARLLDFPFKEDLIPTVRFIRKLALERDGALRRLFMTRVTNSAPDDGT